MAKLFKAGMRCKFNTKFIAAKLLCKLNNFEFKMFQFDVLSLGAFSFRIHLFTNSAFCFQPFGRVSKFKCKLARTNTHTHTLTFGGHRSAEWF